MEHKPILQNKEKLKILIDSASFNKLLANSDKDAFTLLEYYNCNIFEFVRTPVNTNYEELNRIIEYKKRDIAINQSTIEVNKAESPYKILFDYSMQDIENIAKNIFKKQDLSKDEIEKIELVFIQACLNRNGNSAIFVTNNDVLLKNRDWFESHFPGGQLNIVTVNEAKEIMDIFSKYRNEYYIRSNWTYNKGGWYWCSFRSKIPFFHVGSPILNAFANRFVYTLMSIDEMGFQFYSGVNNDTLDNTFYHFNYFISLTSGIFDSLAIFTFNRYHLKFKGMNIPSRISLNKKAGKDFLKAIKNKNITLADHINKYSNFINLIYKLRDLIIHREGLKRYRFESIGEYRKKYGFAEITIIIKNSINQCGDKKKAYNPLTEWGIYDTDNTIFLEPYNFSKSAVKTLIRFSNKFLQLLGFTNFIEELRNENKKDRFVEDIDIFEKYHLGL